MKLTRRFQKLHATTKRGCNVSKWEGWVELSNCLCVDVELSKERYKWFRRCLKCTSGNQVHHAPPWSNGDNAMVYWYTKHIWSMLKVSLSSHASFCYPSLLPSDHHLHLTTNSGHKTVDSAAVIRSRGDKGSGVALHHSYTFSKSVDSMVAMSSSSEGRSAPWLLTSRWFRTLPPLWERWQLL